MTYGKRLNEALTYAGKSRKDLAEVLGCTPQAIGIVINWRGEKDRKLGTESHTLAARFLKVDDYWLATGEGEMLNYMQQSEEFENYLDNDPRAKITHPTKRIITSQSRMDTAQAAINRIAIDLDDNPDYPSIRRVALKAQAGVSGYAVEYMQDDGPPVVFRRDWYAAHNYQPEKMLALRVGGESMVPSLYAGDLIILNTAQDQPKDGIAFVVAYEGEIVVKRLVRDEGQWWLTSDNPDQRRYPRKKCNGDTQIIGEVVYRQTERI